MTISVTKTRVRGGEQHYALEVEAEVLAYLADVLRDYQPRDAGARFIADNIDQILPEEATEWPNPRECCWACEAEPDHCRDAHCACHDFIAVTDHTDGGE